MNQTRKILLQLVVVVGVAGGLGSYAWFGIVKGDEHKKKQADHDLRLFAPQKLDERQADGGSPPAEFNRIVVATPEGTTELERRDKDWFITSPIQTKADHLVVDGITSQLQSAKFKDTLEEDPDAATLAKYGLDHPQFSVEATALVNGESRSVKLVGGKENTFDGSIYVRRDAEKPVFTAEGGVRFMLSRSTFDLRDKATFQLDEAHVVEVAMTGKLNHYVVAREPGAKLWNLKEPSAEPADGPTISTMLSALGQERAQAFPTNDAATQAALGFTAPLVDATVKYESGKTVRLRVTRQVSDGGELVYGLREDDDGSVLAQLGTGALALDRNASDLKDRAVLRFRRELVTKIVFHEPGKPDVIVEKESVDASAESWRLTSPRDAKAKVFKVTGALWTLSNMKARAPGEEHPKDRKRYGLDESAKSITLFSNGDELGRLLIGKEIIGKPNAFYVMGTRDQVLESDGSRFAEFAFSLETLLDEPTDGGSTVDGGVR